MHRGDTVHIQIEGVQCKLFQITGYLDIQIERNRRVGSGESLDGCIAHEGQDIAFSHISLDAYVQFPVSSFLQCTPGQFACSLYMG